MELFNSLPGIMMLLTPFIVTGLISIVKRLPSFALLSARANDLMVRYGVGPLVSLAYILFLFWMTGNLDQSALVTSVQAVMLAVPTWLSSLGAWHGLFHGKDTLAAK